MAPEPSRAQNQNVSFLSGGGDMGARIRAFDWSATPLGPPGSWPHGLKTAVRIMLTSRQAMWIGWGPELTYLYNDAYKAIIGGKHPVALGQPAAVVWREIWDDIAPMLATAQQGDQGTYVEAQLLIMERNGYPEETYYTFSYSPIPDDDGGTGGIICANTDDTERVIRERRLALLGRLAGAAAESRTVDAACARSAEALGTNPRDLPFAALYLTGEGEDTLSLAASAGIEAGHPAAPRLARLGEAAPWPFAEVLAGRRAARVDTAGLVPLPAGAWDRGPAQVVAVPLADRGQETPAGVLVLGLNPYRVFDDAYRDFVQVIAGQVAAALANARAYEEERRRAEALAEIDRAKTVFFSNVSHEFRTPLTLMLGPLEELRQAVDPEVRGQARLVHRNALRLLRLVNTLLDFARIEAGRAQATYQAIDLAELTRDLASIFRSATERAGIRLVVSCQPIGQPVYVDAAMWEKIVLNLISNAFKYTLAGEIEVSLARVQGAVQLRVRDTGTGISSEELPRLFERFHRIEGQVGRTHEGTGIGLALVQELAALHGGTVAVESQLGSGSTFIVTVPLGTAHLPPDRLGQGEPAAPVAGGGANAFLEEALRWIPAEGSESASGAPAHVTSERGRIVVADDNRDMRDYVRRLLGARWDVEAVGNGHEALAAVRRRRPHLLITDVMMPGMNGFALLRAVRGDPDLRDLPVLMLSARAGEEATLEGLEAGADDYLVKPFSARELTARVEAQLLRTRVRAVEERHERRLAAVFAQAPMAIALLRGPDHVFESANPLFLEIIGGRDVIGRPAREALPDGAGLAMLELLERAWSTREPQIAGGRRVAWGRGGGPPDEERDLDVVYQPIIGADGAPEAIALVIHDVTHVTRARRDADVANRAKDEFLAMLGHELRNPLAPILTALQLMRLRGIDAAEKERRVIERQVKHLVGLVDDLLDVSRITRGKVQLTRAPVELAEVVAKAIETASPLFEQKGHALQVEIPRHGLTVDGDADRLRQVFANLLTNAAKYTPDGGRITVNGAVEEGEVVLRIRDTGIGIAADMLPRVFELFVQERQALDRAQGGLGLGLAIVRSLVELHGGRVSAHSDGQGRGAEITVYLPRIAAVVASGRAEDSPVSRLPVRAPMVNRRVLIVDDNEDAAAMLGAALAAYGHTVRTALDGPSALQLAEKFQPDVAVLDIGLPVMDGYELARRFGEHPVLAATSLLAVTGYGQERDRLRSEAAGFKAHLIKPIDMEVLCKLIEGRV